MICLCKYLRCRRQSCSSFFPKRMSPCELPPTKLPVELLGCILSAWFMAYELRLCAPACGAPRGRGWVRLERERWRRPCKAAPSPATTEHGQEELREGRDQAQAAGFFCLFWGCAHLVPFPKPFLVMWVFSGGSGAIVFFLEGSTSSKTNANKWLKRTQILWNKDL